MATARISDEQFRHLVTSFSALTWPMTAGEAITLLVYEFGWTQWARHGFKTGLPIHPDSGSVVVYGDGQVGTIQANVTDWSNDGGSDRDISQQQSFEHFAALLTAHTGGEGTAFPFPRDHDASYWNLRDGARIELRVGRGSGRLLVTSPHKARVDDALIRRGQYR